MIKERSISKWPIFLSLLFALPSIQACEEEPLKLSRAHRKIVDSLVQERKVAVRPELDSLCDLRFATELDQKRDSIVKDRMEEIRRKIDADATNN